MKFKTIFSALVILAVSSTSFADDMPIMNMKLSVGGSGRKLINTSYFPQSSTLTLKMAFEAEDVSTLPTISEISLKGHEKMDIVKPVLPDGCKVSYYNAEIKPSARSKISVDLEGASCQSLLDNIETTDFQIILGDVVSIDSAFASTRLFLSIKNEAQISSTPQ